ncbi:unnamed protein product [Pleuronectes platessa]|uniref:C2H2-type domain-containing protein n=1 Tax=Pleuronectes platessa TaxID=8262 RepID=A0A9N7TN91_PLEPL|nr:unnamed protein product [Pleuronectes platessa]
MSGLRLMKSPLRDRLRAAAQQIVHVLQRRMMKMMKMMNTEWSAEHQRAVVHKRLSVVADDIIRILEEMMNRLSGSDVSSEQQRREQRTSGSGQFKDASTETDSDVSHTQPSHLHPTAMEEKGTSTLMETGTPGEQCVLPPSDREVLSSKDSEPGSENNDSKKELNDKSLNSDTRRTFPSLRTTIKTHNRKNLTTDSSPTAGQSCCRVCGKFFRYKRSFLKHVLQHEHSADLCGVCGRRLEADDSLRLHLQTHREENICRVQAGDKQSEAEAESNVGDSDEDWKDSGGSDSEDVDSDKDETKKRGTQSKSHASSKPKKPRYQDLPHVKYCCKVCGRSFCYRASFLKHVQEDETDTELCGVCGKRFATQENPEASSADVHQIQRL